MKIPDEIKKIISILQEKGFQAHLVGGCVRDVLRKIKPKDWDIATNAEPEEIQGVFPESFYSNQFFTVTVQTKSKDAELKEVEITTYRKEAKYTDKRHPDEIKFAKSIEEDLARRDFTINAIALGIKKKGTEIIDPFNGKQDLEKKIIRAVGNPKDRFGEDALRMLRAVRFSAVLGFEVEQKTSEAIKQNAPLLEQISHERIRDEFLKIIMSNKPSQGIETLRAFGLLKIFLPELDACYNVGQNKHHIYDCYEHALFSLDYSAKKKFNKYVRLASLLHDIGKPATKKGEGPDSTFYNHEIVGTKITYNILRRLKFSSKDIEKITKLVRYHLFYYNVDEVGESSVRRLVRNVGAENIEELLQVRMCDRIGSGVPKAEPYKLRHLKYLIEKVSKDPVSVKTLKIGGKEVMEILNISPGPKVGMVLDVLLGIVLNNPEKNKKDVLIKEAEKLKDIEEKELKEMAEKARKETMLVETKKDEMTKKKYWVT